MYYYVNHQAINDLFAPVEMEKNPLGRAEVLLNVSDEFTNRLLKEYEQTAWELKHKLQWNTGQISDLLNISERKVVLTKADNKNSIAGKGTRYPAPRLVSLFVPRARRHVGAEDT